MITDQKAKADRPVRPFLRATGAMMEALDAAEGLSSHELICFAHNTTEFLRSMIEDALALEAARKFPMRRHDWGKNEGIAFLREDQ